MTSPSPSEIPSAGTLLRSTLIALGVAILLLVTVVLPAEYGVDPTGIGRVLGLKEMGEIKMRLAREAAADAVADGAAATASTPAAQTPTAAVATARDSAKSDVAIVALNPGQGREFKLTMKKNARVSYQWATDRGVVNYDTHGDPMPMPKGFYHGYGKGQGKAADSGTLVAAFDGIHGWFWRNRGRQPVTVTLRVSGDYLELKEIK